MLQVVITGLGLETSLGSDPGQILECMEAGETAAAPPSGFDARPFGCPHSAEIRDFRPERFVPDSKALRLMNRDAVLAVAAARRAMADAGIVVGRDYPSEEIGLFGATGLAGLPLGEVAPLIRHSASAAGTFDPERFGAVALKKIRPILSFRILSNMPICFVSIFENIQGPNAVYNPWEGQGAQAIRRGIDAIRRGEASCVLCGGSDVKTHELAFLALEQQGVFRPWREAGRGTVPGEGAAFLVLEEEERARERGARAHARFKDASSSSAASRSDVCRALFARLPCGPSPVLVSGEEGDLEVQRAEDEALESLGLHVARALRPKLHVGNLFAAAAFVQVALAALVASRGQEVLASSIGHGSEKAAFLLEGA